MAKRANPFIEDFIPQSKVHIGIKQINNNDHRLKNVYEKTLKILFNGAKQVSSPDVLNNNVISSITKKDDKLKQLFIGKDGTLLHSGCLKQTQTNAVPCSCGGDVEFLCGYCDTPLCVGCHHACSCCQNTYCQRCMLGSAESELCISCYR